MLLSYIFVPWFCWHHICGWKIGICMAQCCSSCWLADWTATIVGFALNFFELPESDFGKHQKTMLGYPIRPGDNVRWFVVKNKTKIQLHLYCFSHSYKAIFSYSTVILLWVLWHITPRLDAVDSNLDIGYFSIVGLRGTAASASWKGWNSNGSSNSLPWRDSYCTRAEQSPRRVGAYRAQSAFNHRQSYLERFGFRAKGQ